MQVKHSKILTISVILMLVLVIIPIKTSAVSTSESSEECYGFLIPVNQYQSNDLQMDISKLVNELLRNDVGVYWITNSIYVSSKTLNENSSVENNYFEKGSYIVPFVYNKSINAIATNIVFKYKIKSLVSSYKLMQLLTDVEVGVIVL